MFWRMQAETKKGLEERRVQVLKSSQKTMN